MLKTHTAKEPADPFLAHEALDRCHVIACMIGDHLLQHPYVMQDAAVAALLAQALGLVADAYQLIGGNTLPHPRDPHAGDQA